MRVRLVICISLSVCPLIVGEESPLTPELTSSIVERELGVSHFEFAELALPNAVFGNTTLPQRAIINVERHGRTHRLVIRRHSVRSPNCRMLVDRGSGRPEEEPLPPERTYRGEIAGEPGSIVAASLVDSGLVATVVSRNGDMWSIRPLAQLDDRADRSAHVIFDDDELPTPTCGVPHEPVTEDSGPSESAEGPDSGGGAGGACTITIAEIGFDTDYEFYEDDCGSDTDVCVEIVEQGLNITNVLYERDVKISHRITVLVLRTDPETDFYAQWPDASDFGDMLSSFRREWNANMTEVDYDLAYFMTGKSRPEYGGLAYVGVVCSSSRYGMGIGRRGYEGIFRHEAGHNWGASHSCGEERRFIMCGNSISAISAYNVRVMGRHRDSRSCLFEEPFDPEPAPPFVRLDRAVISQGDGPVAIDVVSGDTDADCDQLRLIGFDARTAFGADLLPIDSLEPDAPIALLYLPRSGFLGTDYFSYTIEDESGFEAQGTVLVEIQPRAMIVHLPFEETAGDETDDISGFGHDGELRDDLVFETGSVAGRFGRALAFTGVDGQYVSLDSPDRLEIRGPITVAAWFRVDGFNGSDESLVSKGGDAYRLKRDGSTGTLQFTCTGLSVDGGNNGRLPGGVAVDDGEWHHAAGVYDGDRIYLYIDGELDNSLPATGLIGTNSSSVRIGDNGWNGPIDEVKIYDYALDAVAVSNLFDDTRVENTDPADGASGVAPGSPLTWQPASSATAHDVYIGDDLDAVLAADSDSPEFVGRTESPSFTPTIEPGTSYWWRVDEVTGAVARRGGVRSFTTSFAYTNFDEPSIGSANYTPGAGDNEIGFRSESTPSGGDTPLIGVQNTSSTPSSPVFAHRSAEVTTTFDPVDLSEQGRVIASMILQARSTGYEDEDYVFAYVTDGERELDLVRLEDSIALTQRAGTDYATYAASIPADWNTARLVVSSSSNSGSDSERYDFDRIGFSCHKLFRVIASTAFDEANVGEDDFEPDAGDTEIGFVTNILGTDGANPFTGVVEVAAGLTVRFLSHRSVDARTTFATVDLENEREVRATVIIRTLDTGYEGDDLLEIWATDGESRVGLIDVNGNTGLDELANDRYRAFSARVPDDWTSARLVVSTSSDSSAGAEGFDVCLVEFTSEHIGDPCSEDEPPPPPPDVFRRGDVNDDARMDLSDGVRILNYLFLGDETPECLDAADTDNSGDLDLSDGVNVFNFLFLGGSPPPTPGSEICGPDTEEEDSLDCAAYTSCAE
jgi:hypothetical protein